MASDHNCLPVLYLCYLQFVSRAYLPRPPKICTHSSLQISIGRVTEQGLMKDFHVSQEVAILSVLLFVLRLGLGPIWLGSLSEFTAAGRFTFIPIWSSSVSH